MATFGSTKPPEGWSIAIGELVETRTVLGYARRKCEVSGHCYQRDCQRKVHLGWLELIKSGQAQLLLRDVTDAYTCSRIGRCAITWTERPAVKVTLGDLTGRDHIAVEVTCMSVKCGSAHVTTVEAMIARLGAQGVDGAKTDAFNVAAAIPGPCSKCQGKFWRVRILWHDPGETQAPLWFRDLAERRSEARLRDAERPMAVQAATTKSRG